MRIIQFFSLLLLFFSTGCKNSYENTVIIHSLPSDSLFTEITISKNGPVKNTIISKGGETCRFTTDSVDVRNIYSCSNGNQFNTRIFITPGDSVSWKAIFKEKIEDNYCENYYEIIFEGKNAPHYNYALEKEKILPQEDEPRFNPGDPDPDMDLPAFKQKLQDYRDKESEFLDAYKKKHKVSQDFINYASAEINNKYAVKLFRVAYFHKKLIPADFLNDAVITGNSLSESALTAFDIKYNYLSPDLDIQRIYNSILNEVSPEFQSKVLARMVSYFAERGESIYKEPFLQVMGRIEKTSSDSTLLNAVKEYKPFYLISGTSLPDSILDQTYFETYNNKQKITLRKLLNNYKDKGIYLDIWASWCYPCRMAIRQSEEAKSYLTGKGIVSVYISGDEDENAWIEASKEEGITDNQYRITDAKNSPLFQYLKITAIPRYILFNNNHEVVVLNAPRPVKIMMDDLKEMIGRYFGDNKTTIMDKGENKEQNKESGKEISSKAQIPDTSQTEVIHKEEMPEGVIINGIYWATRNVDTPGTFTKNPEDAGMFYQWNRKKAWPSTGEVSGWNNSLEPGRAWEKKNDPSPAGWRLPTQDEILKLIEKRKVKMEWTKKKGVIGTIFTDIDTGGSIFLPAPGYRNGVDGKLQKVGIISFYWSVEHSGTKDGYYMYIRGPEKQHLPFPNRNHGYNIRCVKK
jgi:uncharacterized protein (TIGR02145 family)